MPLVDSKDMFRKAYEGHYAVGAFNVNNMEIIQGIVEAAIEEKAPLILQVSAGARKYAKHIYLTKLVEAAVEDTGLPICLHLDHGADFEICKDCVDGGFTSVMIDGSKYPFEENIELTKRVVDYAHSKGVVVEAELGKLAGAQMMCAQARLSKDQNTQMGAVLVSAEGRVISTGYNGAPAGFDDETVPYTREKQLLAYDLLDADSGEMLSHHEFEANKYPFMVHAEINALHYARGKVPPGSKLYVIGFPCERCALDVSLSGVAEVFVTKDDYDPKSTLNNSRDTAYYMFAQAGIVVTLCGKRIRPVVSKPQK